MSRYGHERQAGHDSYEGSNREARRSPSPAQKRRAVAADYFEDDDPRSRTSTRAHHHRHHRHRDRSGEDSHREHKRRKHHHNASSSSRRHDQHASPAVAELPFKARPLSYKHDLDAFEPLFANYLDIQKGKDYYSLDAYEQKGRWKSFVNKWNGGQLAEGWYEPEMFERIAKEAPDRAAARPGNDTVAKKTRGEPEVESNYDAQESLPRNLQRSDNEEDEDDDDYGPPPPPGTDATRSASRKGPGIPSLNDLALRREAAAEAHEAQKADLRLARKVDRAQQKEALEELVPRAEPGTRERKLEKKAAVNEKMRSFREKGDVVEEMDDGELMGGGDGVADFKRAVANQQRKKTERELRREEEARARWEEREEKLKEWRAREEEKMKGLKELAKARFG
ncbi:hypothetical protein N0V93_002699 [Gnomoniopsis smithogilvyi]|uniref:Uncharacterized protein n=1 Tax=Gnomoniopsis smithogilvyi TaxID=1191159 RepID=A0A9W8YZ46_9PEZI|nr:hypothetical protein N0V93_002699 [Gnomoniopsis smithogilvyi]